MPGNDVYRKSLQELSLAELAELCGNVAHNHSANHDQSDEAHALRMEWIRLAYLGLMDNADKEAQEESLRERMQDFLKGLPAWMTTGI